MLEMLQKMQRCPSSLDTEELWRKQTALSELLISAGTKVSHAIKTLDPMLKVAVSLENASLVKLLLKAGADVNAVDNEDHGHTAIHKCLELMSKFLHIQLS